MTSTPETQPDVPEDVPDEYGGENPYADGQPQVQDDEAVSDANR